MVNSCCAPGCTTGYKSNKSDEKVPLFQFPSNEELRNKWLKLIPRKNWTLSKSHRVCAKHFTSNDFFNSSTDTCVTRRNLRESDKLSRIRLKPNAVPTIFPSLPKYLSASKQVMSHSSSASASARLEKENLKAEKHIKEFLEQDSFSNFSTFNVKVKEAVLPSDYLVSYMDSATHFHYIQFNDNVPTAPQILASFIVNEELQVKAYVSSAFLPQSQYAHLLSSSTMQTITELTNILAWCKALADRSSLTTDNHSRIIDLAISLLEHYISEKTVIERFDEHVMPLLHFVIQQLKMLNVPKQGRRYSVELITTSFLWQLTSTSLYKKLRNFFILPSLTRLRQLSVGTNVQCSEVSLHYLRQRTASLSPREKIVTLMVDEVYTAQRVEYNNGAFIGLTENGTLAKTVLTFMVQSTHGNYKDVVCVIPVDKLDTKTLHFWFQKVMLALHDFLLVVAVSVDNHICNRKLFIDLCHGELKHSIEHPTKPDERLFLLFDFTHNFKNIFNNFVNKQRFNIPTAGYEELLGQSCIPSFAHIRHLYSLEEQKSLKIAHALKKASLNPTSISRTSPQHALSIFHESTIRALDYYSGMYPSFMETARFLKLVGNLWKILSVKTPFQARRQRDELQGPLQGVDGVGMQYLKEARDIFLRWKASGNAGLTRETFLACIQSIGAVQELAQYLQQKHGFSYLLCGKLTSDPIEARFGWYRQVNGGNYFMCVKQLLQAEKKIRVLSLLQQQALLSGSRLNQLDALPLRQPEAQEAITSNEIQWLIDFFSTISLDELSCVDVNITYFISGYVGRSVSCRRKCSFCREMLVAGLEDAPIQQFLPDECRHLFEMADRGGLAQPTEYCYTASAFAVQFYTAITNDEGIKQQFLSVSNQRDVFMHAMINVMNTESFGNLVKHTCSAGHSNFKLVVQSTFNCFAKNELKRLNCKFNQLPETTSRKLRKLASKS